MRTACAFLLCLLLSTSGLAQSALTIDKLKRKDINTEAKEVAYSTLIEGTVNDPDLAVYVLVHEPRINAWRSYRASVDRRNSAASGPYRWGAICHFGEFDGRGVGASYQVRAIAIDPKDLSSFDWSSPFEQSAFQTNAVAIKRVKR
jgi:hypothetical protein